MKPHQGPSVPHRTSRSRALEIGTNATGFADTLYDPQAGTTPDKVRGHYVEQAPEVTGEGPKPTSKTPIK